jgi:hypothetical protein
MRDAASGSGSATADEVDCFSNTQNHSPADPNPLRTDRIPSDSFALLNGLASLMR